jgi:hypothetical protein
MNLDESREHVIEIDGHRMIQLCPTEDGRTLTLAVVDPLSAAVVELTMPEVEALIEALQGFTHA